MPDDSAPALEASAPAASAPAASAPQDKTVQLLKDTFGRYLVGAMLDSECFLALQHFAPLIDQLGKKGVVLPKIYHAVSHLVSVKLGDPAFEASKHWATMSGGKSLGLQTRMRLFESKLYEDFLHNRAKQLCVEVMQATTQEYRLKALDAAVSMLTTAPKAVGDQTSSRIGDLRSLFARGVSACAALSFALEDSQRISLAASVARVDGDFPWGFAQLLRFASADSTQVSWSDFLTMYETVTAAGLMKKVTNPIMKSTFDFISQARVSFQGQPWVDTMTRAAAGHRLMATWSVQFNAESVPDNLCKILANRVTAYLAASAPEWLLELQRRQAELDAAAKEELQRRQAELDAAAKEEKSKQEALVDDPSALAPAAPAPVLSSGIAWRVGDILKVDAKNKNFNGFDAQIEAITKNILAVRMIDGPKVGVMYRAPSKLCHKLVMEVVSPQTKSASAPAASAQASQPAPQKVPIEEPFDSVAEARALYGGAHLEDDSAEEEDEEKFE